MPVRPRGSKFQADFMLSKSRIRETFDTQAEAEAYEMECRAAHKLGKPIPSLKGGTSKASQAATLGGLVDYCELHHWRGRKAEKMLVLNARQFASWCGPKTPVREALTPAKVDEYLLHRATEKRNSNATLNRHTSSISVLVKNAARLGHIPSRFEMKWKREGVGRIRFYSQREEAEALTALMLWGRMEEAALIQFLADTGCRLGEARKLLWRDIDGRRITFVDTKNGETRSVVATDRVLRALELVRSVSGRKEGPFVWVKPLEVYRLWKRVLTHCGIEDGNLHTWRHTCASRLVQRGVDLYRVKAWMGHKNISTTQRYAHLAPKDMETCADALNGLSQALPGGCGGTVDAAASKAAGLQGPWGFKSLHPHQ